MNRMNPELQHLVDRIEKQREMIMNLLSPLTTEQLNRAPLAGKWSAAEILSHIVTAERLSVLYVQKKMQGIEQATDSGLWEEVKISLLKISQRLPWITFKAPRRVLENTRQLTDLGHIKTEWDAVRNELNLLLEKIPAAHLKRMVYKHPIAGYLNIKHTLIFLHEHIFHHTPQLKKLIKLY